MDKTYMNMLNGKLIQGNSSTASDFSPFQSPLFKPLRHRALPAVARRLLSKEAKAKYSYMKKEPMPTSPAPVQNLGFQYPTTKRVNKNRIEFSRIPQRPKTAKDSDLNPLAGTEPVSPPLISPTPIPAVDSDSDQLEATSSMAEALLNTHRHPLHAQLKRAISNHGRGLNPFLLNQITSIIAPIYRIKGGHVMKNMLEMSDYDLPKGQFDTMLFEKQRKEHFSPNITPAPSAGSDKMIRTPTDHDLRCWESSAGSSFGGRETGIQRQIPELGGLGPNLGNPEYQQKVALTNKLAIQKKEKDYSESLRSMKKIVIESSLHRDNIRLPLIVPKSPIERILAQEKREKVVFTNQMLEYAQSIKLISKSRKSSPAERLPPIFPVDATINELQQTHESDMELIRDMKRQLGL